MPFAAIMIAFVALSLSISAIAADQALGQSVDAFDRGRHKLEEGDSTTALAIWKNGLNAPLDVRLADAFVGLVFDLRDEDQYVLASETYLRVLLEANAATTSETRKIVRRHASQMIILLDEAWRSRIVEDTRDGALSMRDEAGPLMAAWWRREDPLPATPWNERLIEHLERVAHARRKYRYDRSVAGFDARGEIYLRFGKHHVLERLVSTDPIWLIAIEGDVMPENELWVYRHFGHVGTFLFVRENGYRLASPIELLPPTYRVPFKTRGRPGRAGTIAYGLYEFYEMLSRYSPEYMHGVHMLGEIRDRQQEVSLQTGTPLALLLQGGAPGLSMQQYDDLRLAEFRFRSQREEVLPTFSTDASGAVPVPIDARVARFLNEDGSTRAEITWMASNLDIPVQTLFTLLQTGRIPTDDHVLRFTAVELDQSYRRKSRTRGRIVETTGTARIHTAVLDRIEAPFAARLQVDHYVHLDAPREDLAFVRSGTFGADSLHPLNADPTAIEMSDIVLFRGGDPTNIIVQPGLDPADSLGVFFELYHLSFGDDDVVHYEIEYALEVRSRRSLLSKLLGRPGERKVTGMVRHRGTSRTIQESILLDLFGMVEMDVVELTVTATDLVTGRSKTRSTSLVLSREHAPESGISD